MARPRRLPPIPFGWYYVAMRAVRDRQLCTGSADLDLLLKVLQESLRKNGAHLHAGCVTRDEIHLVVQSGELPLQNIARSFCHEYARRQNSRHRTVGSLFQSHPRILLIQHQVWLVRAAHVIHWIPHRWWSTDALYRRRARHEGIVTHALLHLLTHGARNRDSQYIAYREKFDRPPSERDLNALKSGSADDPRILGDSTFVADVWRRTRQRMPRRRTDARFAENSIEIAMAEILEEFISICDEKLPSRQAAAWKQIARLEQLRSHSRKSPLPLIRALVASKVINCGIASQTQIAKYFGYHPKTLSTSRRQHFEALLARLLARPRRNG